MSETARLIQVVEVRWVDSAAVNEWTPTAEVESLLAECITVGLLIHSDSESYLIASSYDRETDSINAAMQIPSAAIRRVKTIGMVVV